MAKACLFVLLCAALLVGAFVLAGPADQRGTPSPSEAGPSKAAPVKADGGDSLQTVLTVQMAMLQAREFKLRGENHSAVFVLESHLAQIDGNQAYLALLCEAYRAYIRELRQTGNTTEIERYQHRLQRIDPGAALESTVVRGSNSPELIPKPAEKAVPATTAKAEKPVEVVKKPEEDKARAAIGEKQKAARGLLAQAEDAFGKKHYPQADALFVQAYQADPACTNNSRNNWAYCKLFCVREKLDQLNKPGVAKTPLADLEKQTRQALELSPQLDYAKYLLHEVEKLQEQATDLSVQIRHFERDNTGRARAETANFRIFHNLSPELAEQVARTAERTRDAMARKWFGKPLEAWPQRCDVYLHPTVVEYQQATGLTVPGHFGLKQEELTKRIVGRRLDFRCEDPRRMVMEVLPHEATHAVLSGQFGNYDIPRWADEGIALLSEPAVNIQLYAQTLERCRTEGTLMAPEKLMKLADFPEPRYITAFYAESISLVDFLVRERGPQVFTEFVRNALKNGYEPTLEQYYGFKTFADFERKWSRYAFSPQPAAGVAQKK